MRILAAVLALATLSTGCATVLVTARVSATAIRTQPRQVRAVPLPRASSVGDVTVRTLPAAQDHVAVVIENHSFTQSAELLWDRALYRSAGGARALIVQREDSAAPAHLKRPGLALPPRGRLETEIIGLDGKSLTADALPPAARDGDVLPVGTLELPIVVAGVWSLLSVELTYRVSVIPEARTPQVVETEVTKRLPIPPAQRVFCILTGWYYGGACWLNFIWPTPSQRHRVAAEAYEQLVRRYGPELTDVQTDTERTGW